MFVVASCYINARKKAEHAITRTYRRRLAGARFFLGAARRLGAAAPPAKFMTESALPRMADISPIMFAFVGNCVSITCLRVSFSLFAACKANDFARSVLMPAPKNPLYCGVGHARGCSRGGKSDSPRRKRGAALKARGSPAVGQDARIIRRW